MRRIRKILLVFATILFVLPSFLVSAASNDSKSGEDASQEKGKISSKDEVVYAKLSATGERQEIYVVNILDIEKAGKVADYGPYSHLKNLTDLANLEQKDQTVEFTAPKGKFYYQGDMNEVSLPWDISITYFLNGKEMLPEDLAGKDGHVQIRIKTSANEKVDSVFYQNYLLQISMSLNLDIYRNIEAPDGMLANAGKNKQVTFTVMPEKEAELIFDADVVDFELEGIDITAIPSSLPIDAPNIDDMTDDMETLSDAIGEVNQGVAELNSGVAELNSGVKTLSYGSKEYIDGISAISQSSSGLVGASESIQQALDTLNKSLSNGSESNADLKELGQGLAQMAVGLRETSAGLTTLKDNYSTAYSTLDSAMAAIPEYAISEQQIGQLRESGADQAVVAQLLETYSAARNAKGTYSAVKEAFGAVGGTLETASGSLTEMAGRLDAMANGLASSQGDNGAADSFAKLQKGLSDLASNYKSFHSGLVDYTGGISQLSSSYSDMHNGIVDLSQGTGELEDGVSELHDGTDELHSSTSDLPDQMKKEVDQMMNDYDKSDFKAVSFVSPKNEKINSVQFVFKTKSIKQEEPEETSKPVKEEKGFWARLMNLFE